MATRNLCRMTRSRRGRKAHHVFSSEFIKTIGYSPGRRIHIDQSTPDGFTPEGFPCELKPFKEGRKEDRYWVRYMEQLRRYMIILEAPEGELWGWKINSKTNRFEFVHWRTFRLDFR